MGRCIGMVRGACARRKEKHMHHLGERTRQALRASWEEALVLAGKYALWARLSLIHI